MLEFTLTNSAGQSIVIGKNSSFLLKMIDGTSDLNIDIIDEKIPNQLGEKYLDSKLNKKRLYFEVILNGENQEELRRQLIQVLNPALKTGKIEFNKEGKLLEIYFVTEEPPNFTFSKDKRGKNFHYCQFGLLCHTPFWIDYVDSELRMAAWVKKWHFPQSLEGSEFGGPGEELTIINEGDVPTPVIIVVKGVIETPSIANVTTGEYISVNKDLEEGDELIITTEFGNKSVKLNGVNAFNHINLDSTFWHLMPGENTIAYGSSDPSSTDEEEVYIYWRNRYIGI